jgi:hypothetical protein
VRAEKEQGRRAVAVASGISGGLPFACTGLPLPSKQSPPAASCHNPGGRSYQQLQAPAGRRHISRWRYNAQGRARSPQPAASSDSVTASSQQPAASQQPAPSARVRGLLAGRAGFPWWYGHSLDMAHGGWRDLAGSTPGPHAPCPMPHRPHSWLLGAGSWQMLAAAAAACCVLRAACCELRAACCHQLAVAVRGSR